ncbi:hypothetical protein HK096_008874, partial [Nowakowskiella sp. JEL0078]
MAGNPILSLRARRNSIIHKFKPELMKSITSDNLIIQSASYLPKTISCNSTKNEDVEFRKIGVPLKMEYLKTRTQKSVSELKETYSTNKNKNTLINYTKLPKEVKEIPKITPKPPSEPRNIEGQPSRPQISTRKSFVVIKPSNGSFRRLSDLPSRTILNSYSDLETSTIDFD